MVDFFFLNTLFKSSIKRVRCSQKHKKNTVSNISRNFKSSRKHCVSHKTRLFESYTPAQVAWWGPMLLIIVNKNKKLLPNHLQLINLFRSIKKLKNPIPGSQWCNGLRHAFNISPLRSQVQSQVLALIFI
jgi:hypothetical protein